MAVGRPGRVVAERYTLRAELGRGGMGVVWRAWDAVLEREVAVKEVLVPEHLDEAERAEAHARIRREGQAAARIPHPAVITIHDVFEHDAHPWIVMDLVEGRSLEEILRTGGPVGPGFAHRIAVELLGALSEAHRMGVIHRDIKPANIMVTDGGRIVLTDFGIAAVESGATLTGTGSILGSPAYMAPEQLDGGRVAQPASDLWSLGATLYAAVEGQSPFRREALVETLAAIAVLPIPQPRRAGHLAPLIIGLLQRDPQQRLTIEASRAMLRNPPAPPQGGAGSNGAEAGTQSTPASRQTTPGQRTSPRQQRLWVLLGGGVFTVVLALVAATLWIITRPEPLTTAYERYEHEHFTLIYPEGWEPSDWEEDPETEGLGVTFDHPTSDILIQVEYMPDPLLRPLSAAQDLAESYAGAPDFEIVDPAHQVVDGVPSDWTVAQFTVKYTDEGRPNPLRQDTMRVLQVDESDIGYAFGFSAPASEAADYEAIRGEVFESFEPLM